MLSGSDILSPWLFNFATSILLDSCKQVIPSISNPFQYFSGFVGWPIFFERKNNLSSFPLEFLFQLYIFFSGSSNSNGLRTCVGCGGQIHDQYILRVAPNLEWHAACLKCCECQKFLDEKCTCFVREGKIYCKEDYVR